MKKLLFFGALFLGQHLAFGQTDFYKEGDVHELKMYFTQPNWDHLLDSFFIDGDEERLLASIEIDGESYDSIGVRYKGFSSASIDRIKNPFNIKLDWIKDHKHEGVDKIKLSNVIHDPSFIRETLAYEVARKYMPASGANYAKLFINDVYWGVYTNVQDVDKGFLRTSFGSGANTFVKADPVELDLKGENCNLSNSPGTDTAAYAPFYEMKSDYGYGDLYELIDVLNNDPDNIEDVLNVDRTLWMHAFNYVLINFDGYVGYAQNYYLYKDGNGQFNPILWDLNQSFASYRLTDASDYFNGFTIDQAKQMDPLLHHNSVSVYPRPLMRNLFKNDRYRKMYLAHIKTITEENFASGLYKDRATSLQSAIDASVLADTNKFYSYADFLDNKDKTVSDLIDYPGITDLMDDRTTYLQAYAGYKGAPIISVPTHKLTSDNLFINAEVSGASDVILAYRDNDFQLFNKIEMKDDGMHNDGASGDGVYGALITGKEALQYYIYADNSTAGSFSPARAAYEFHAIEKVPDIAINEVCSSNDTIIKDPQGEYEDWIELYNNTDSDISLKGYFLSDDNSELDLWEFPDTFIAANSYLLIWADKDDGDFGLHAEFKLSSSGEAVFLSNPSVEIIDDVIFGAIPTDTTYGRSPNGSGAFFIMSPTPGAYNEIKHVGLAPKYQFPNKVKVYPNPSDEHINISMIGANSFDACLISLKGEVLATETSFSPQYQMDITQYPAGIYFLQVTSQYGVNITKLIIE